MERITLSGREYDILFDANVLAAIQERYGGIEKLGEKLLEVREAVWILTQVINEAMDYKAVILRQEAEEHLTEAETGMLLGYADLFENSETAQAVVRAFNAGVGGRKNPPPGRRKQAPGSRSRSTSPGSSTSP